MIWWLSGFAFLTVKVNIIQDLYHGRVICFSVKYIGV